MTLLILLHVSAVFDIIDHTILFNRLKTSFGISELALAWFHSYLEGHSQFVRIGCSTSPVTLCATVVPQGFVLGPMLFPYSSHPLHILSVHMTSGSSSTLTTLSSISPYPKIITILQLPNSSCLWTLHTTFCYNGLALNTNSRKSCLVPPSAHILFQYFIYWFLFFLIIGFIYRLTC